MKKIIFLLAFCLCPVLFASLPDVVITVTSAYNGYATVAGRLTAKPEEPVGVTVRNGNIAYATVTDPDGRWSIVIRHISIHLTAQSFSLSRSSERGVPVKAKIE
ncbi:MAG: hypothetical protein HY537_13305 [Deltaproteobacteria bacterium]|nr:hypothetical protein [Deltaproteobacteria bacterium]